MKVLVTTKHRGVFFGELVEDKGETVILGQARNCLYWTKETRGFLGLASKGPQAGSRVGPSVPSLTLHGVTAIAQASDEAIKAWEEERWSS